jgi:hypothetical protein
MIWTSARKPAYDSIVAQAPAPAEAVQIMIDFETAHGLTTPLVYVSTAITSGGFRRDPRYSDPAAVRQAIDMNNAACASLMAVIASQPEPFATAGNVMVPTELGAVPQWTDSRYLEFYFAWCAGLTGQAAAAYSLALASPELASIRAEADARTGPTPSAGPPTPSSPRPRPSKRHSPAAHWEPMRGPRAATSCSSSTSATHSAARQKRSWPADSAGKY